MDLRKLKKLIDLVEESGISELELTEGEEKVRISRNVPQTQTLCITHRLTCNMHNPLQQHQLLQLRQPLQRRQRSKVMWSSLQWWVRSTAHLHQNQNLL